MILVDTGALYALIDKNDIRHADARTYYEKVAGKDSLYISLPLITETCLLIEARLGNYFANKFWLSVSQGIFKILELDRNDLVNALAIENKYQKAGFGFVDSTCFALCEKHKIRNVFTYDRKHFRIYKPTFSEFLELLPYE